MLTEHALILATEHDLSSTALRAHNNLAEALADQDLYARALQIAESGVERARRVGDRRFEELLVINRVERLVMLGRWDEAHACVADSPSDRVRRVAELVVVEVARGHLEQAEAGLEQTRQDTIVGVEWRAGYDHARALLLHAQGRPADALAAATGVVELRDELGLMNAVKLGLVEAVAAALDCDLAAADEMLGVIEALLPGQLTPFLKANALRFRARLDAQRGLSDRVDERFAGAEATFRELSTPFWLAVTLVEHAEWRHGRGDDVAQLIAEAREIFERLRATPWLERLARLEPTPYATASSGGEA